MALTAEEKIKILYEDSLKDIRDLTTRIEGIKESQSKFEAAVKTLLSSIPAVADREIKRASSEAITTLSGEVGKIAQKVAGNAAIARKAAFILSGLVTAMGIFALGITFGATYSATAAPYWINQPGIFYALIAGLISTPVGGYALFTIALNIFLLRKILIDLMTEGNTEGESLANAIVISVIAVITSLGAYLCYVSMFQKIF
ncbi:hypothetical protein COW64_09025 [bacterium (Candidatus Blackallbacteria) CG18_big_fil_WC_8_21_14_2_50_49_26]|nr:MAG: hypothetical protein COW64_09025 [bacterium (Candidatus Blackallbacteria) CG18_big_fil_WC_8_21_14_2_50_49_26]